MTPLITGDAQNGVTPTPQLHTPHGYLPTCTTSPLSPPITSSFAFSRFTLSPLSSKASAQYILGYPSNNHTFSLLLVLYVLVPSIYSFFYLLKVTFSGTQKPSPPTVFNLQASDWVHCEEETDAYHQLSQFT